MFELERAKSIFRPSQTLNFFVDPSEGHDDYLMSLALVIQAAKGYLPRKAMGTPFDRHREQLHPTQTKREG
jgi:hypothetical protein